MKSFISVLLLLSAGAIFSLPINENQIKNQLNEITSSKNLSRQLENIEYSRNNSNYALKEEYISEPVEKIRSVDLFKAKVSKRIDQSIVIPHFPGMKTKLLEIAVEKFKLCEISRGSSEIVEMEQSCLGIATAQMMSLIHAFEKNPSMHF